MRHIVRRGIRTSLRPLERVALCAGGTLLYPPIFIVSPPRSGSTLLYLLAVQKFHLSYFSNFAMMCPESPGVLTWLGARFGGCAGGKGLENRFGETSGWNSPNQGYRAWNQWFSSTPDFISPNDVPAHVRKRIRHTIGTIERATNSPFINKWQRNTTRVQALSHVFPEAVFLQLKRDPLMIIQSIIEARRKLHPKPDAWFSARPRSYVRDHRKDVIRQAVEQVVLLERDLEEDKALVGRERFFTMSYERLCENADLELETFGAWYAEHADAKLRSRGELDVTLKASKSIRIDKEELAKIQEYLNATS